MDGVWVGFGDSSVLAVSADLDGLGVDAFACHVGVSVAVFSSCVFWWRPISSSFPRITYGGNGRNFVRSVSGQELSSFFVVLVFFVCWCGFAGFSFL